MGPKYLVSFFYTMLLPAHVERVSVSRMRDIFSISVAESFFICLPLTVITQAPQSANLNPTVL